MRIKAETIKSDGERISSNSKFYIYEDILYEPCRYDGNLTGTYKPIKDAIRIEKIMTRKRKSEKTVFVSSIFDFKKDDSKYSRFELLDL